MTPIIQPWIGDRELSYVRDAIETGWVSPQGEYVREFEDAFAGFVGTEYAFAVSTGTAALHLSLIAKGIGEGDEVIVPDLTYIACANVVRYVGGEPVFVDVEPDTYTLDPAEVSESITSDTVAIMPVHLYGQPCRMDPLLDIAEDNGLFVIEDAAEAHGATYCGTPVGALGDVGCFSFYGNKVITTGQGGMITTNSDDLAEKITLYRRDGMHREKKYFHPVIGYNYRLTNLQAALGVAQLERIGEILASKRRIAEIYRDELEDLSLNVQAEPTWSESAHWINAPVFEAEAERTSVVTALHEAEIATRPFFPPLHTQPPYEDRSVDAPVSDELSRLGLNLPSGPCIDLDDVRDICDCIRGATKGTA